MPQHFQGTTGEARKKALQEHRVAMRKKKKKPAKKTTYQRRKR